MSLYENRTPEMQAAQILRYVEIRYDAKDREEYLRRFLGEIFERVPGLRGHFVGLGVENLCEELARRVPSTEAYFIVQLIEQIEQEWSNQS